MRTNIFIKNEMIIKTLITSGASLVDNEYFAYPALGLMSAETNGDTLKKSLNLVLSKVNPEYLDNIVRESRVIPLSACNARITESVVDISGYYGYGMNFEIDDTKFTPSDHINEDVGVRLTIPAEFNHRHTWSFSHRVKANDTVSSIQANLYKMIANSSLKEYIDIKYSSEDFMLFVKDEHNFVIIQAIDSLPQSALIIKDANDEDAKPFTEQVSLNYLTKVIVDADANYGFDYINCPEGDLYPNKLTAREVKRALLSYGYQFGLTHIVFNEPRFVETTGDVVNQVINIIHPLSDNGNFDIDDYEDFINLIGEKVGIEADDSVSNQNAPGLNGPGQPEVSPGTGSSPSLNP